MASGGRVYRGEALENRKREKRSGKKDGRKRENFCSDGSENKRKRKESSKKPKNGKSMAANL